MLKLEFSYYSGWVVGGWVVWWVGGLLYETKFMLKSTQVEVLVEVEVELGKIAAMNSPTSCMEVSFTLT